MTSKKPWGGRFHQDTNALVEAFTESISFDHRLSHYDIQGSIAHARVLEKVSVLTSEEAKSIENEEMAVLQIQQRTGNVRIDSGGQSKPMNTACYSMLNGSRVAVK